MANNNITGQLAFLDKLVHLTTLNLNGNNMTGSLPCLSFIKVLNVQNNRLEDAERPCLPSLTSFNGANNSFTSLRAIKNSSELEFLDISNNPGPFSNFDLLDGVGGNESIPLFRNLRSLRASNTSIVGPISGTLQRIRSQFPHLEDLDLSLNHALGGAMGNDGSISAWFTFDRLAILSIDGLPISGVLEEAATVFFPNLQRLSLRRVGLNGSLPVSGRFDFPMSWQWLKDVDLRGAGGLSKQLAKYSVVSPTDTPVVDDSRKALCAGALMVGDLATFRLARNPDQDGYRFCKCLDGYFGDATLGVCQPCPNGALCKGGTMNTTASWPVLNVTSGNGTTSTNLAVVQCPSDRSRNPCGHFTVTRQPDLTSTKAGYVKDLVDSNSKTICSEGHEGRLCAKCLPRFYRSGRSCLKCKESSKSLPYWLFPTAAILVQSFLTVKVLGQGSAARSGLLRTLILHFQLFAALPRSLEVGLPDPIRAIFQGSEQGTSLQLEGLECAEKGWDGFFAPFGFACALPICVLMASPLLSLVSDLWQRFRRKSASAQASHPLSFRGKLFLSFSYLWLVLVFGASRRILSALNCTAYGGSGRRFYVFTALWVQCNRSHGHYVPVFALGVLLGPAFLIATVVLLVRSLRAPERTTPYALRSFLEAPYRGGLTWWELVQTSRRLVLAMLQALVPFQSATLPVGITVLLTASLAVHTWCKPFRKRIDNMAESLSLSLLLVTYMVGLVIANAKFVLDDRGGTDFAAWLVVALNGLFLLALFLGLFTKYASIGIRKGRKAFGSDAREEPLLDVRD